MKTLAVSFTAAVLTAGALIGCSGRSQESASGKKPAELYNVTCYKPGGEKIYEGQSKNGMYASGARLYFYDTNGNKVETSGVCFAIKRVAR
jgi:hypothetical protein